MITAILGQQGSGKTLLSLYFARSIQQYAKDYYGQDIIIYTNINATGEQLKVIDDLGEIPFDQVPKMLIVDEAMFSLDSRSSSSHDNQEWIRAIAFFRKAEFIFVAYCTHLYGMLDTRLRGQMNHIFMCRKSKVRFEYLMVDTLTHQSIPFYLPRRQDLYDYVDFDTRDFPNPISTELLTEIMPMISAKTRKQRQKK